MRRGAAPGKQNLHWALFWPCSGDDALEIHRAQSGLDPPQGGKQTLRVLLAAAVYRISSLNPSWEQAFVTKPNSPDSCLLERSFGCLI